MPLARVLPWRAIHTVLLDMDGTLLDLHYDNHFWLTHVPRRYAERHGLELAQAAAELRARYARIAGRLEWYCVDYWSRELDLDIARLKAEVAERIRVHPHVETFLAALRRAGKRVVLVTNAHQKSLALKMQATRLETHFDAIVCAHDLGVPKEAPAFWPLAAAREGFDPATTLLVDDSLPVLAAARDYGIAHLLAVARPDSRQPPKDTRPFPAVEDFAELLEHEGGSHPPALREQDVVGTGRRVAVHDLQADAARSQNAG